MTGTRNLSAMSRGRFSRTAKETPSTRCSRRPYQSQAEDETASESRHRGAQPIWPKFGIDAPPALVV